MSMRQLHDLSRVYLESVAAKPDYLDFDKDGNKKEPMKKALKDKEKVTEAVRGQDTEMRKVASQERQSERKARGGAAPKIPGREGPSAGKSYADYQQVSMKAHDKATRGKYIPGMVKNESLDPVGREDADIDNDGDTDKSDKYLHKRRKAIGKAITTRKESFSNWRQDLSEVMDKIEKEEEQKQIKEKKNINNKIVINPEFKEAVEELGGVLLETAEVEEGYKPIGKEKESAMYRRAGNLARTSLSSRGKKKEEAQTKSAKIVSAITRQKEKERFDKIGQSPAHNEEFEIEEDLKQARKNVGASKCWPGKVARGTKMKNGREVPNCVSKEEVEYMDEAKPGLYANIHAKRKRGERPARPGEKDYPAPGAFEKAARTAKKEEFELDEKTLTPAETKKKEEIVMSMKKKGDFSKYGKRAKEVMYATATKQAKKLAEADMPQQTQDSAKRTQTQQKQKLLQILQQKERAVRAGMTDISASYEPEGEQIAEKQSALDIVKAQAGPGLMTGATKKPKLTPAQKAAAQKASAQYIKKTSDHLHSSPRD